MIYQLIHIEYIHYSDLLNNEVNLKPTIQQNNYFTCKIFYIGFEPFYFTTILRRYLVPINCLHITIETLYKIQQSTSITIINTVYNILQTKTKGYTCLHSFTFKLDLYINIIFTIFAYTIYK